VSSTGGVLDVTARRVVHNNPLGDRCRIQGTQVIYQVYTAGDSRGRRVAVDLVTHKVEQVARFGNEDLPDSKEFVSPGGTKAIGGIGTLMLYEIGKKPRVLGTDFETNYRNPGGPLHGWHPVLWLDNDRIMTQVRNGELVVLQLDGTRTPVTRIPVGKQIGGPPSFSRDGAGRIIYHCGGEDFAVDVVTGKWERREWADLGHGFERRYREGQGGYTLRYNGRVIGQARSANIAADEGYLAAELEESGWPLDDGSPEVWEWSAATGKGSRLNVWTDQIIGWMK
jgi:hypothetical protein